jgi:hypothetical protein
MKVYEPMSLGELIARLEELGDALVRGLDGSVHSYRGYYERNCTEPSSDTLTGASLAKAYRGEIGKEITGWKGGDFYVSADELIYYADTGNTGPAICALEAEPDGVYEVVAVVENFW